jgi:hypothetical protein
MKFVLLLSLLSLSTAVSMAAGEALPTLQAPSSLLNGIGTSSSRSILVASLDTQVLANTTLVQELKTEEAKPAASFTGEFGVGYYNSLYRVNDQNKIDATELSLVLGYALNPTYKVAGQFIYLEDYKAPEGSDWARARLLLKRDNGKIFSDRTLFSAALKGTFPVAKAHFTESYQGALGLDFTFASNPELVINKKLSLGLILGFSQNFHKFETAVSGKVNTKGSMTQRLSAGWNFTDTVSISALIDHISAFSYLGATREFYAHSQELAWQATPAFAVAVGHAYGQPQVNVRKANGEDYNYNLADEDNSSVYGSVTYTF